MSEFLARIDDIIHSYSQNQPAKKYATLFHVWLLGFIIPNNQISHESSQIPTRTTFRLAITHPVLEGTATVRTEYGTEIRIQREIVIDSE